MSVRDEGCELTGECVEMKRGALWGIAASCLLLVMNSPGASGQVGLEIVNGRYAIDGKAAWGYIVETGWWGGDKRGSISYRWDAEHIGPEMEEDLDALSSNLRPHGYIGWEHWAGGDGLRQEEGSDAPEERQGRQEGQIRQEGEGEVLDHGCREARPPEARRAKTLNRLAICPPL